MSAIDTNVLIYACDRADTRRQKIALDRHQPVTADAAARVAATKGGGCRPRMN